MEISIPFGGYDGKPTPFGGPSLEWAIECDPVREEEISEEAHFSVRNVPTSLLDTVSHIRRMLSEDDYPRTSAFVHRMCFTVGVPVIEKMFEENQKITSLIEGAYLSSDPSTTEGTRDLSLLRKSQYELSLGDVGNGRRGLFARNKSQVSTVRTISEDLGLSISKVAVLCFTAGLSQSVEGLIVPKKYQRIFEAEVRFFEKWLKR